MKEDQIRRSASNWLSISTSNGGRKKGKKKKKHRGLVSAGKVGGINEGVGNLNKLPKIVGLHRKG